MFGNFKAASFYFKNTSHYERNEIMPKLDDFERKFNSFKFSIENPKHL